LCHVHFRRTYCFCLGSGRITCKKFVWLKEKQYWRPGLWVNQYEPVVSKIDCFVGADAKEEQNVEVGRKNYSLKRKE
jgi:hypothetical protein